MPDPDRGSRAGWSPGARRVAAAGSACSSARSPAGRRSAPSGRGQKEAPGAAPATAINAIDVLVTDFGTLKIVPSRLCLPNQLYFFDYDFWSIDYLRPFQTETLAKTGDSIKQLMIAEYGLRAKNGLANAAVIGVKDA